MAIVTATFVVADKRAAQMELLLRGLSAYIALEAEPHIEVAKEVIPVEALPPVEPEKVTDESQDNAAEAPQEVESGQQGLLRTGNEDGDRQGQEPGEADERDGGECADAAEDGIVAWTPGEGAAA